MAAGHCRCMRNKQLKDTVVYCNHHLKLLKKNITVMDLIVKPTDKTSVIVWIYVYIGFRYFVLDYLHMYMNSYC